MWAHRPDDPLGRTGVLPQYTLGKEGKAIRGKTAEKSTRWYSVLCTPFHPRGWEPALDGAAPAPRPLMHREHSPATTPAKRWKCLGALTCARAMEKVKEMQEAVGGRLPEEVVARESGFPPLRRALQIVVRPDGYWVPASLANRLGAIAIRRFMADCDTPSAWRAAHPSPNTPRRPW